MSRRQVYVIREIVCCYDCPHFWRHPQANGAPYCTELGEMINIPGQVDKVSLLRPAIPDRCPLQEVTDGERSSGAAT